VIPMSLSQIAEAVGASCAKSVGSVKVHRVTTDSRDVQRGDLFVAIRGERFDGHEFVSQAAANGAAACLCSREGPETLEAADSVPRVIVDDTVEAIARLAAFYRRHVMDSDTIVVAVTGSNGKTTTKCMIDHVLSQSCQGRCSPRSFNNEIGVPLTILSSEAADRYLIAEVGTNAPGEVAALASIVSPDVAVITSIGEAHLEGLGDVDAIAAEKASLLDHLSAGGLGIVNLDREEIRPHLDRYDRTRIQTFGMADDADFRVTAVEGTIERTVFELDGRYRVELPLPGSQNAGNAAAAFAVARRLGVSAERIIERLGTFTPPLGRSCLLDLDGLRVVDDTYNANPVSMAAAIKTLSSTASGRRVLVMGDMLELGPQSASLHRQAVHTACEAGIDVLLVVGPAMTAALSATRAESGSSKMFSCADADAAIALMSTILQAGDNVWIKASRAMQLDRVADHLKTHWSRKAAVA